MTCVFTIDSRESQLKPLLEKCNQKIDVKQLDIGDFVVEFQGELKIVIERKTVADLVQSIKDNRYREQKVRLLSMRANVPDLKVMYLLEGNYSFDPGFTFRSTNNKIISGAIINSMIRDGIYFVFTKTVSETAEFLVGLMDRVMKDPEKYFCAKPDCAQEYSTSLIKTKKKENITHAMCLELQMCAIPGISTKKAKDVIAHYQATCMKDLVQKIDMKSLQDIDGIGKKLAEAVCDYLG